MITVHYENVNDTEPWGKRKAPPDERLEEQLKEYLTMSDEHIVRLLISDDAVDIVQHVTVVPENTGGWDGAPWMHTRVYAAFDNRGDRSFAIHNLIATAIYNKKADIAKILKVEDVPYLSYKEIREITAPVACMDVELPWAYGGTAVSILNPVTWDTSLQEIVQSAKSIREVLCIVHTSVESLLENVEIIKKPIKDLSPGKRRSAFISHSSHDKEMARKITRALEEKGFEPWLDEDKILVGQDFVEELDSALTEVDFVVVLLSPQFLEGPWAKREYKAALEREAKEGHVVILPVLLENCEVPTMLRTKHYADMRASVDAGMIKLVRAMRSLERCKSTS
jgi:hypothetical protein